MPKVLIIYYSKSGNTKKMAQLIAEGVNEKQVKSYVKSVQNVKVEELLDVEVSLLDLQLTMVRWLQR